MHHTPKMQDPDEVHDKVPPGGGNEAGEEFGLAPEDVEDVIELDQAQLEPGEVAAEMGEMDLVNYEEDEEDEGMEEGAVGGVPPREDAKVIFSQHTGSVFCCHIDPASSSLAVTGGEDDTAYVWRLADGSQLLHCKGHQDSVTCASFSHDSRFVATSDMSGIIKVWKVESGEEVWGFEVGDMEWLDWHPSALVLFAGTVDGDIWMWKVPSGDCKTFQSHGVTCNIAKVMPDGRRACAGYQDGVVKIWDLKGATPLHTISGHTAHTASVTSMDCHRDNNIVITGSTDITAKLINTSTAKVVATFNCQSSTSAAATDQGDEEQEDSVEAVGFSPIQAMAATGTLNGSLVIWDVSSQTPRHTCKHEAGIVRLRWASDAPLVYTGTLDGAAHLWDCRTGREESTWYGHTEEILDLDLARDGSSLVTASGDKTARVFSIR